MRVRNQFAAVASVLSLLFVLAPRTAGAEGGAFHRYIMRGAVVESSKDGVYLCIGTADNAQVGEELAVVRVKRVTRGSARGQAPRFERESVGKIRIDAIVDQHYARATVLSGNVRKHDIAELAESRSE